MRKVPMHAGFGGGDLSDTLPPGVVFFALVTNTLTNPTTLCILG
jgi:hypothetical protein